MTALERPAGRPACGARPAGAQNRHTRRTVTDLVLVRDALAFAEEHGTRAAADRAGVAFCTVYRWQQRRRLSGGVWPTDADVAAWKEQDATAGRHRAAHRSWQLRVLANGGFMLVDATGTIRRLQALLALGHRYADIAVHSGHKPAYLGSLAVGRRPRVNATTVARISGAYDVLSMTLGPSQRTRTYARNRGWAPPLAWDDQSIDDPKARPHRRAPGEGLVVDEVAIYRAMHGDPVGLRPPERRAVVERLTAAGMSSSAIAERLGTTQRSVVRHRSTDTSRRSA